MTLNMTGPDDVVTIDAALDAAISARRAGGSRHDGVTSTGFCDVDEVLCGGLWPGQLHVVVAGPAAGRSMLLLELARLAAEAGVPALYASPQHDRHEVALRLLSSVGRVPLNHLRSGLLTADDWSTIDRHRERIAALPLRLDTSPLLRLDDIVDLADRLDPRPRFLALDGTPADDLAAGAQRLAQLARLRRTTVVVELAVPDAAGPASLADIPPPIAEAADVVLTLHREDLHDPESLRPGEADIRVVKSRHSPTFGPVTVAFQGHYARFVEMVS